VFPVVILYVPPAHCVHGPPLGPFDPALQIHAVMTILLAGENEFAGHKVQILLAEYELTAQEGHGPPLGPGNSASQKQSVMLVLASGEFERAGQSMQLVLPITDLYLPGSHHIQSIPSGPVCPLSQIHAVMAVLPKGAILPPGQYRHQ